MIVPAFRKNRCIRFFLILSGLLILVGCSDIKEIKEKIPFLGPDKKEEIIETPEKSVTKIEHKKPLGEGNGPGTEPDKDEKADTPGGAPGEDTKIPGDPGAGDESIPGGGEEPVKDEKIPGGDKTEKVEDKTTEEEVDKVSEGDKDTTEKDKDVKGETEKGDTGKPPEPGGDKGTVEDMKTGDRKRSFELEDIAILPSPSGSEVATGGIDEFYKYNPSDKRDPFRPPNAKPTEVIIREEVAVEGGTSTPLSTCDMDNLKLKAVIYDPEAGTGVAMVTIPEKGKEKGYTVRIGTPVAGGRVVEITPYKIGIEMKIKRYRGDTEEPEITTKTEYKNIEGYKKKKEK